jgi:anaerobic magnesium-protoporphyrin IX monomethyl ester cyclase
VPDTRNVGRGSFALLSGGISNISNDRKPTLMDSKLANITSNATNRKKILLLNPCKQDGFSVNRIHMGLSLLGGILKDAGHEVMLMDFAFLRDLKAHVRVPEIEDILDEFQPAIVGISVFTYLYDECEALIERISSHFDLPIILGGPHFSVFHQDFTHDSRISYIVRGEAEKVILNLVQTAKRERRPVYIECPVPIPQEIPAVNVDIAYGSEYLKVYQIQLSRGCPYNCSFCNVEQVAGRKVRARDIEVCLEEITDAKKRYPQIMTVTITDDCPTFDKDRFKRFLRMLRDTNTGCELSIDNVRANLVDEEMIQLYIAAGGRNICLGAETGHPEVFKLIRKGESLADIVRTAKLVRKYGLVLGLCFVIGLPEDNLERHMSSIRLARMLKPDYVFWNMSVPWPGTDMYNWYKAYGKIGNPRNFSSLVDPRGNFTDPVCVTNDFSRKDRIRAWFMSNLETHCYFKSTKDIWKLFVVSLRYNLCRSLVLYLARCFLPQLIGRLGRVMREMVGYNSVTTRIKKPPTEGKP